MRHVILLDFRDNYLYDENHIRNSLNLIEINIEKLQKYIDYFEKLALDSEEKYKSQKIRRLVVLSEENINMNEEKFSIVFKYLMENYKFDKTFFLAKGYLNFKEKYSFLCVNEKNQDGETILYSYSRFPSEIIEDLIFLGDIFNSNSKKQLNDLKIKSLIDFVNYEKENQISLFKKTDFNYTNIAIDPKIDVIIDFDEINRIIDDLITKNSYPILIYCKDGDKISPAFIIAFLMYKRKIPVNIASLIVFQKRANIGIEKWIYSQLLQYIPQLKK